MKNTTENNKLIAEFMGNNEITVNIPFSYEIGETLPTSNNICKTIDDCENEVRLELDEQVINGTTVYLETPQYHTSWDLLMPVINKIGSRCEEPEELDNYTHIMIYGGQIMVSTDIQSVYLDVVECIKWYNQQNKTEK